jgi:CxxC-x17-CxxC domain-containing protein
MIEKITFFAETTFRNQKKKFGIKTDDRRRHMYIIGKTGMGKTAMLRNMAIQDIQNGQGIGFVDPHGEVAEELLDLIPSDRINDVVYFNPGDLEWPIAFNIMEKVGLEYRHLIASGLMAVFKKIWPDVWSARMEYILNNSILALLEYPDSTLLGVNRMLSDSDYRKKVITQITDPVIKSFWTKEFARYTDRYTVEATAAIQNKIGQFISTPLIRNIIGQVKSTINMREIMDKGKILILNLSKGKIGEDSSLLLGSLLITKLQLAAMSRVDIPEQERKDFYLYVDEFQNFATRSFVNILSEARKYRLALILGHQYITQMEDEVKNAVFGNIGTLISFRVGAEDAEYLEKEFSPEITTTDLVNLAKYNIYLKLMIDGLAGRPFSAQTLAPLKAPEQSNKEKIIKTSQERYGTDRKIVDENINRWSAPQGFLKKTNESKISSSLYSVKCFLCGKPTKVIFPPDEKRPIYCKSCFLKKKTISLENELRSSSHHIKEKPKKERKAVKLEELKEVLRESLERLNFKK